MKHKGPVTRGGKASNRPELDALQSEVSLGTEIQSKIGDQLRALYDDVINQGVPDRFADLLKRLEEKGGGERA